MGIVLAGPATFQAGILGPQIADDTSTISVGVDLQTHQLGHRQPEIGVERTTLELDKATLFELPLSLAGHDHGQVIVLVRCAIAEPSTPNEIP